jgi:phosphopantothenoylcysteine decarboxylase / phosphopantothenate---cysteine ligase
MNFLKGKKIILGLTGGIAIYKSANLLRRLTVDYEADVQVVMTRHAKAFMTPLIFETFSGKPVLTEMFEFGKAAGTRHIDLVQSADMIIVAPATANIMGKMANGIADDLLSTMLMVAEPDKVWLAPAMNKNMYLSPFFQKNLDILKKSGIHIIEPETGELATRQEGYGIGRLPAETGIIAILNRAAAPKALTGKKIVITAGPTREHIDAVRFISNPSTGKMGLALAEAAHLLGADVTLIAGPGHLEMPTDFKTIQVNSAQEMHDAAITCFADCDALFMAAAVEDIQPAKFTAGKIKKEAIGHSLTLKPTIDILNELGKRKANQTLVGFSVEVNHMVENSQKKLQKKNLDFIVMNNPDEAGAGFAADTNHIWLMNRQGELIEFPKESKKSLSVKILSAVFNLKIYEQA